MNQIKTPAVAPDRRDLWFVLLIALGGLLVYTRVLAPDVLYSDSGEFQTLAYTWGTTHTTGYPVYLVLARVIGLLPINTLAWRINFASAVAAAVTLGSVYLIARHYTQRAGALLASLVLLLSYTFWSQSIIAEVYTPATALIVTVLLALLTWHHQPLHRRWWVFGAGFLVGAGLGVHLFLILIAPTAGIFVLWGILWGSPEERGHWGQLIRLIAGGIAGVMVFFLLFALMDVRPTPTNIFTTSIYPSRDAWNLQETDLDSVLERFWLSASGAQWQDRMIPADEDYWKTFRAFLEDDLTREYATPTLLLALLGIISAAGRQRRRFALLGIALVVTCAAGLVYFPGDKYIFYLPAYLLLAIFAGIGAGTLIAGEIRLVRPTRLRAIVGGGLAAGLLLLCAAPLMETRWLALQTGRSTFIAETYVYPVNRPQEARLTAECALSKIAESEALLVMDWRALYATYYVAHVEQGRTGLLIHEAAPYPAHEMMPSLLAEINERVQNSEAVYVDQPYNLPRSTYTLTRSKSNCSTIDLLKVSLRN
ncbi:MAG TPA: DUF2723 domain-containing protein [Phototrophicaceae bacterium]|nr:DUF2723 domain-containing protein [Phototrophicaceae bacterium]